VDYKEGENLKADITVEVFPEINFPDFSQIEVKIPAKDLKVEAYDEKKQIDAILEGNKRRIPVNNREVRDNDLVMVNIQSKFLDTKRMTPKQKSSIIVNKEETFEISNVHEEIKGKNVGDNVTVRRTYLPDFSKKKWAGKEMEHHIAIEGIFELKKPTLDKEFLKNMGFEDEQSFKKQLKVEYDTYWEKQLDEKKTMHIFDELTRIIEFDLPMTLVDHEFHGMKHQAEQVLKTMDKDKQKEYIESLKRSAKKSVKLSLIFEALQKRFNFEVTNDDLEKEYKNVAEKNKYPLAEVRRYYSNKDARAKLKDTLLRMKILDFIKEKIKIKEV
jgi:trigger factor